MDKISKRSDKVAFYGVVNGSTTEYKRMRGFTELSINKNPVALTNSQMTRYTPIL